MSENSPVFRLIFCLAFPAEIYAIVWLLMSLGGVR